MKALVLGSQGMLGHVVATYFQERGHTVKGTSRHGNESTYGFDATKNISDIKFFIDDFEPDVVINCVGILNKVAEDNKTLAVMVNSYLPHYIDDLVRSRGIKFVHVSTDCVFEGNAEGGYTESSLKDATSFYGRSKALGEVDNSSNVTLRTSIIGPDMNANGTGLFQWFMSQQDQTNGFDKVIWTGVTTIELAKAIEKAIDNNLTGIRHVVNNQSIDKHALLSLIKERFNKDIEINRKSDYVSNKSLIRKTDFDFDVPSYDNMIQEMREWVDSHEDLYSESQRSK